MYCLAIETSCDDTCVAIIKNGNTILSNVISSQIDIHRRFGGVVPEVASRRHLEYLIPALEQAFQQANLTLKNIDLIAVTRGPGLTGSLLMGLCMGKTFSILHQKPFIAVNHLEGHLFASRLDHPDITPPFISLIVSGGHTELTVVQDWGKYVHLGRTRDDAAGEVFDKVAKYLKIGYPGGPLIDNRASNANPTRFHFRGGLEDQENYDFSFSGLKTAVIRAYDQLSDSSKKDEKGINDLLASFQQSVVRTLWKKTIRAVKKTGIRSVSLGGGVAANSSLRSLFSQKGFQNNIKVYLPSPALCTDNAAMIGSCGSFHFSFGRISPLDLEPDPQLRLGDV
ncbi:tRNA (adenosine(37)-N6)-threonylcarbamoyltransferase complex transferase subunit TsaD [Atribacter laminatus]|jgi:N6-L-threonylcarbamoyladenine synthase|uniref:tRNA N6-adenosine threonylcarbamoyltransferase n=1 Tax=Atribacter laminatus TaxID=2847778 RepID=A0A7T1ANL9_ATRLM|nr:tRNA (adenosine(37)-N6)-threonylcarbamoyltransferase complex transferase subunit TsaD [Atribacter laminatus]QPM69217.1 tRNA N6-adenosine threonylcarbamoyltransferase [Atribacter laminatus]